MKQSCLLATALSVMPMVTWAQDQSEQIQQLQQQLATQQQQLDQLATTLEQQSDTPQRLHWAGYAVMHYQRYDFYENSQDDVAETRSKTDLERVILQPTFEIGDGYRFVAEIEFEHGGTGATVEFEKEEFGEYEMEVEKGGEVVLEQAYLEIEQSPYLNWRIGEIVVPVGLINSNHQPSEYFTVERSLAEQHVIPSVWHETGIELFGQYQNFSYQIQCITALDSSGFSGLTFVANGAQGRLEFDQADDLALVLRGDYLIQQGISVGASFYYGNSTDNRARQNVPDDAAVTVFEAHTVMDFQPVLLRAQWLQGEIENSDLITRANQTAYNSGVLGISQTAVGHQATAWFIESGLNAAHFWSDWSQRPLWVFARAEGWDTHKAVEGNIVAVDRYQQSAWTVGVNFQPKPGVIFKTDYRHQTHEGTIADTMDVFSLGLGVEF